MSSAVDDRYNTLLGIGAMKKVFVGDVCFVHFPSRAAIGTCVRRPAIIIFIVSVQGAILAHIRLPRDPTTPFEDHVDEKMETIRTLYFGTRCYFPNRDTRIVCAVYGNTDSLTNYIYYINVSMGGYGIPVQTQYISLTVDDTDSRRISRKVFAERGIVRL